MSHVIEIRMAQKGQSSTRCSIGKLFIAEDVIAMVYISLLVFGKIVLAMLRPIYVTSSLFEPEFHAMRCLWL